MRHSSASFPVAFCAATFALLASAARAQFYGPGDQVLTIGAAEFRLTAMFPTYIDSDGYLYFYAHSIHWAPLSLPEGALLEKMCIYVNDTDPDFEIQAVLVAVKLVPGGEGPWFGFDVGNIAASSADIGYDYHCSSPFSYTLRGRTDIDGDGISDAVAYYVYAEVPLSLENSLGLGGVQIAWKRQVSDPPPTPTFSDVPPSDPAFQHIEALVASGITAGCAGGNFCPDANLTRRQMAVFLAKALGLNWAE
jgi:S-layer homology domain